MSEEKGKISVIVPVYQAEKYLAKALDSVISRITKTGNCFCLFENLRIKVKRSPEITRKNTTASI